MVFRGLTFSCLLYIGRLKLCHKRVRNVCGTASKDRGRIIQCCLLVFGVLEEVCHRLLDILNEKTPTSY